MDSTLECNQLPFLILLLFIIIFSSVDANPTRKFPLNILKNNQNKWRTLHIELEESSGPVSPEFQYRIKVYVQAVREGFFIYKSSSKGMEVTEPVRSRISEKKYLAILSKLLKNSIHLIPNENLPKERLLGVSYNMVSFKIGKQKKQFYYLLQDIDKNNFNQKKEIVKILKEVKP